MLAEGASVQPLALNAAPSGTTIGPALPAGALWICEASGLSIPLKVNFQQTFLPLIVIVAVPLPVGEPFGTSALPDIFAFSVAVPPALASAKAGARPTTSADSAMRRLIGSLLAFLE